MSAPSLSHNPGALQMQDLGLIPYLAALEIQKQAVREVAEGGAQRLLFAEHPPVITLGRNSGAEHLHVSPDYLAENNTLLVQTSRGGSITCHFPGQLLIYPILRLDRRPGGLRRLVRDLENAVIQTLAEHGLAAQRIQSRPGVWVGPRKIASIGLALKNWVSYHGLALNVGRDTSLFDLITPCGLHGVQPTSVHRELDREQPDLQAIKLGLVQHLDSV